jgi:uncharacterized protein
MSAAAVRAGAGAAARKILACLLVLAASLAVAADAALPGVVSVPPMRALVTDLTGTLTADQQAALESRLRQFGERKGSQVAVLIVPTTAPESIEAYSLRVVDQWKVGRQRVDDGVLLLVAKDDRTMRIEVGYGLEGALPDATAKRIISEIIAPRFKEGDYVGGIASGTDRIMRVVDGEPLPPARPPADPGLDIGRLLPIVLVVAFALGGILRSLLGRVPGAAVTSVCVGAIAWFLSGLWTIATIGALLAFVATLAGLGTRGGLYGLGGGRGGAGGFGGGGGGRFGGGGASGRW